MAKFVNFRKRGIELPPGCKDLIDVLKENRKAKAPSTSIPKSEPTSKPDLFPSSGIGQIERYVTRILVCSAKFAGLMISDSSGLVARDEASKTQGA